MKKIFIGILLIIVVAVAIPVGYVLFSNRNPQGNGSATVYDYENLGSISLSLEDSEQKGSVVCWRTLYSDTRYLVRLHMKVTGSPYLTLELTNSDGASVYSNTATNANNPEFEFGPFPDGDYMFTFRSSTAFIGASGFDENAEFFEKFPSEDDKTDWVD